MRFKTLILLLFLIVDCIICFESLKILVQPKDLNICFSQLWKFIPWRMLFANSTCSFISFCAVIQSRIKEKHYLNSLLISNIQKIRFVMNLCLFWCSPIIVGNWNSCFKTLNLNVFVIKRDIVPKQRYFWECLGNRKTCYYRRF